MVGGRQLTLNLVLKMMNGDESRRKYTTIGKDTPIDERFLCVILMLWTSQESDSRGFQFTLMKNRDITLELQLVDDQKDAETINNTMKDNEIQGKVKSGDMKSIYGISRDYIPMNYRTHNQTENSYPEFSSSSSPIDSNIIQKQEYPLIHTISDANLGKFATFKSSTKSSGEKSEKSTISEIVEPNLLRTSMEQMEHWWKRKIGSSNNKNNELSFENFYNDDVFSVFEANFCILILDWLYFGRNHSDVIDSQLIDKMKKYQNEMRQCGPCAFSLCLSQANRSLFFKLYL